jgi:hypothetical protein
MLCACAFCHSNEADEPLTVQVFGPTDWLAFQQLVLASLAGGRVGALGIPDLVGPGPGEKPN